MDGRSSDASGMTELRRCDRRRVTIEAVFELDGQRFDALLRDLSPFGGFVSTEERPRPGAIVKLHFDTPEGVAHAVEGRVIRIAGRRDDHIGFGVEFAKALEGLSGLGPDGSER